MVSSSIFWTSPLLQKRFSDRLKVDPMKANPSTEYSQLNFLRALIDNIDSAILSILAHRAQVVNYIIEYKALHHIEPARSQARQEAIDVLLAFAVQLGLDKAFIKQLLEYLFQESSTFLHRTTPRDLRKFLGTQEDMLFELNRTLKNLDMAFCSLLAERMQLVKQVGEFKKAEHLLPLAKARWEAVLKAKMSMAESLHMNPEAIVKFYTLIHDEALRIESALR